MVEDNIRLEEVKITLVGDYVGKTAFINRVQNGYFEEKINKFNWGWIQKDWKLSNGTKVIFILWDTPSQERFKSAAFSRINKSHGVLIMYDITSEIFFDDAYKWIKNIRDYKEDIPIIIIRNKCELEDYRIISKYGGERLTRNYNYHFYESSWKLGINIEEPINDLIEQILKQREENKDKHNNISILDKIFHIF